MIHDKLPKIHEPLVAAEGPMLRYAINFYKNTVHFCSSCIAYSPTFLLFGQCVSCRPNTSTHCTVLLAPVSVITSVVFILNKHGKPIYIQLYSSQNLSSEHSTPTYFLQNQGTCL